MNMEKWKIIKGYNNIYRVSNLGRVQSKKNKNGKIITKTWRDLSINKRGAYLFVVLYKDKKRNQLSVHRLVAEAFIPNPEKKEQVNHKNGNKHDNRAMNLEWATQSENMRHSIHILHPDIIDKRKRKIVQLGKDGTIIKIWSSALDAANALNLTRANIVSCCRNYKNFKTAGGYHWQYLEEI